MAKVTFEDGTIINFDGKPSSADIDEAYKSVKGIKTQTKQQAPKQGVVDKIGNKVFPQWLTGADMGKERTVWGDVGHEASRVPASLMAGLQAQRQGDPNPLQTTSNAMRRGFVSPETQPSFTQAIANDPRVQQMGKVGRTLQTAGGVGLDLATNPLSYLPVGGAIKAATPDIARAGALATKYTKGVASAAMNNFMQGVGKASVIKKDKLAQEATNIYRNILRPSKSEISKIEVGKGGNIDDYYKLAAKEGLPIKKSANNTLDTLEATDILQQKQVVLHEELNQQLASNTTQKFNLVTIGEKAKTNLNARVKNASELKALRNNIDELINAEIERNNGRLAVDALTANNIKQGMWSVSYNKFDATQNLKAESARAIGNIFKGEIETRFPNSKIRSLNKISGDYATLEKLLDNAHGRAIPKGFTGKIIGAITGHGVKGLPAGSGTVLGSKIGGSVSNLFDNPDIASRFAAWKMRRALK
jgi:hypothetical protein